MVFIGATRDRTILHETARSGILGLIVPQRIVFAADAISSTSYRTPINTSIVS